MSAQAAIPESVRVVSQSRTIGPLTIDYEGTPAQITAVVRWDDTCRNGHNTFSITGTIRNTYQRGNAGIITCGAIGNEIARYMPDIAHLVRWHLFDAKGPLHYIANTLFHASAKDCWGHRAGEPSLFERVIQFGAFPILIPAKAEFLKWLETAQGHDFEVIRIEHGGTKKDYDTFHPRYTLGGAPDKWWQCPFQTEDEGLRFLAAMRLGYRVIKTPIAFSKGKPRDLDAARQTACWPDATDAELISPNLEQRLKDRAPALLAEFYRDVTAFGFTW